MSDGYRKQAGAAGSPVALVNCPDYSAATVDAALDRALELSGGLEDIIKPGMRVLIKVNLVMRKAPEFAATTHPEVVRALCARIKALGAQPVIGDSPGGPLTAGMLKSYYNATGMKNAAERSGAELALDDRTGIKDCPDGAVIKHLDLTRMVMDADVVISCSKLKTHGMTMMTGCVKNLFGCVPGVTKVEYHARFPKLELFSGMLIDIERCVRPVLGVLDAVDGMEGEGPTGGTPRHIGALVVSRNLHALDYAASRLLNLEPEQVCTLERARERGLLDVNAVELRGDALEPLVVMDYKLPPAAKDIKMLSTVPVIGQLFNLITMPHPKFDREKCVKCGVCARSCPAKAIALRPLPRADLGKCIRCFCCQELCPQHAVKVQKSLMRRFIR